MQENGKKIVFTVNKPIEKLETEQFMIEGTSPNTVTVKQKDAPIKTIVPDLHGHFQYSGKMLENQTIHFLLSDGQNEQEVLIHSLASVRERETINLYAYGINEPLTYFTHGSNDQNGLIQFKVVCLEFYQETVRNTTR